MIPIKSAYKQYRTEPVLMVRLHNGMEYSDKDWWIAPVCNLSYDMAIVIESEANKALLNKCLSVVLVWAQAVSRLERYRLSHDASDLDYYHEAMDELGLPSQHLPMPAFPDFTHSMGLHPILDMALHKAIKVHADAHGGSVAHLDNSACDYSITIYLDDMFDMKEVQP